MERYEELVKLLGFEEAEDEQNMLKKWIQKSGIEKVYQDCLEIMNKEKQNKD